MKSVYRLSIISKPRNIIYIYRGKSPITDPLSYLSDYKRYQKIIYKLTASNLMINKNNYYVFKKMQSYNCYLIKCNILVLLFKYLNNNFFLNYCKYFIN